MFIVKMADHDGKHRCLVEKNVPISLILPSRWRDGAESLEIEHQLFMVLLSRGCSNIDLPFTMRS